MLTARRLPTACHSCRSQLLALFEHGFTQSAAVPTHSSRSQLHLRPRNAPLRSFATTVSRRDNNKAISSMSGEQDGAIIQSKDDIERVVKSARNTFGDTLPESFLSNDEYTLYERLYGPPLRATLPSDLEIFQEDGAEAEAARNVLLRENEHGEFEEVEVDPLTGWSGVAAASAPENNIVSADGEVQILADNQREADAIERLRQGMTVAMAHSIEIAESNPEETEVEEEEDDDDEEGEEYDEEGDMEELGNSNFMRVHPNTNAGRWGTQPSTVYLPPATFVNPITELLSRVNNKHLHEAAERAFGGEGLPHGPAVPYSKRLLPQKHIGLEASQNRMSEVEADAYMAVVMPGVYATVRSTLVEVRKRLGSSWLRDLIFQEGGPKVLDAGAGGAGAIAWQEVLQAEWDTMIEEELVEGEEAPRSQTSVLTGPSTLRHRMSQLMENTTFLPRLPDYLHSQNSEELLDGGPPQPRKVYDIVIAPHTLFPLKDEYRRKEKVENLWTLLNPNGGVLILIEKGLPRGFEAIGGARDLLLERHISSPEDIIDSIPNPAATQYVKEKGMIIAPCTNHTKCPMYMIPGESKNRKDYCHFNQRYIRPAFLQRIHGAKGRNHEDVRFSYLAVRRGIDARETIGIVQGEAATDAAFAGYESDVDAEAEGGFNPTDVTVNPLSLPRLLLPPLKRTGHVTMDLCTPAGKLERWTVPRSFSKQAYRDARKSAWGDLWALGAKTRLDRTVRLGKDKHGKDVKKTKKGKNVFEIGVDEKGWKGIKETVGKRPKDGKRTKRGRMERGPRDIREDEF